MTNMDYTYTSARVRALEEEFFKQNIVKLLTACNSYDECIQLLNANGVEGSATAEILDFLSRQRSELIQQLFEDKSEIEVIFYIKTFHNVKAAIKKLCAKTAENVYYNDTLISGEYIESCISAGEYDKLPEYMAAAAKEAYHTLLRTGDGQLSDTIVDKACLTAMISFAENTKYEILKKYAYETVAAADIKIAVRGGEADDSAALSAIVDCPYFSRDSLIRVSGDKAELEQFLRESGFNDIDMSNIDKWSERRIARIAGEEKYDIFSPSPAINLILALERRINAVQLILVCKENGIDNSFIERRTVIEDV